MAESPAIPAMTGKHRDVVHEAEWNAGRSNENAWRDIVQLVRGIVSGEIVCVSRESLQHAMDRGCSFAEGWLDSASVGKP